MFYYNRKENEFLSHVRKENAQMTYSSGSRKEVIRQKTGKKPICFCLFSNALYRKKIVFQSQLREKGKKRISCSAQHCRENEGDITKMVPIK